MKIFFIISFIGVFCVLFKVMYILIFFSSIFIFSKIFRFDESKWERLFRDKLDFKRIIGILLSIYVVNIVILTIISKFIYLSSSKNFPVIYVGENFYLIVPCIYIIKIIYKFNYKRKELIDMSEKFKESILKDG